MATGMVNNHFSCIKCNKEFNIQTMYACYHGHYLCKKCYRQHCLRDKQKSSSQNIRNSIILHHDGTKAASRGGTMCMFPNPRIFKKPIVKPENSLVSIATIMNRKILNLGPYSKRPVCCPHDGCNKTIAVSALDAHFEREHREVALVLTPLEQRNNFEFFFSKLYGNIKTLCLLLINLEEDANGGSGNVSYATLNHNRSENSASLTNPKPFFIVTAAKVTASRYDLEDSEEEDEDEVSSDDMDSYSQQFTQYDRIIFYVASNIATNLCYTLALSTVDQQLRVKYFGPILEMNQNCKKLCDEGKGLILTHHHINGMSKAGRQQVSVDVLIHNCASCAFSDDEEQEDGGEEAEVVAAAANDVVDGIDLTNSTEVS